MPLLDRLRDLVRAAELDRIWTDLRASVDRALDGRRQVVLVIAAAGVMGLALGLTLGFLGQEETQDAPPATAAAPETAGTPAVSAQAASRSMAQQTQSGPGRAPEPAGAERDITLGQAESLWYDWSYNRYSGGSAIPTPEPERPASQPSRRASSASADDTGQHTGQHSGQDGASGPQVASQGASQASSRASTQTQASTSASPPAPRQGDRDGQTMSQDGQSTALDRTLASLTAPADTRSPTTPSSPGSRAQERPRIAIVVDDLGIRRQMTRDVIALPGPLTLSFLPYARGVGDLAERGRAAGHELIIHVPMEPMNPDIDPGPNVLLTGLSPDQLRYRLAIDFASFDGGYVGINNHMGSRFTADESAMAAVFSELKRRNLYFLDSLTTSRSVAERLGQEMGVPVVSRDVFVDHFRDRERIDAALRQMERIARQVGSAVGIAHPYPTTVQALRDWLPTLEERGFDLVGASRLIEPAQTPPTVAAGTAESP